MSTDALQQVLDNGTDQSDSLHPAPPHRQITLTVPRVGDLGRRFRRSSGASNGGGSGWSVRVWVTVGLVLVALAVANVWLLGERRSGSDVEAARVAALEEARARVPVLLSYAYDTLDDDLESAEKQTTGDFGDDYADILDEVVEPNARSHKISTEAVVEKSAIVDGDEDEVVVLVFLTQTTLSKEVAVPEVTGSRVEVTMRLSDGRWLIGGLEPV